MNDKLPPGPAADLFAHLRHVHLHAGKPSYRKIANDVDYSYTTVHSAIRGPKLPQWGLLEEIGKSLGADLAVLKKLWTAAREAADRADESEAESPYQRLGAAHRGAADLLTRIRSISTTAAIDLNGTVMATERPGIHQERVNRVLFTAGSQTMATVGADGILRLRRTADPDGPSSNIQAHRGAIHGASFNHDGSLIATAGADRTVKVWNVKDGSPATEPMHHDRTVRDVAFGLPGGLLVSVSSDGTARVWDPLTGKESPHPFQPRARPLLCVTVSADGGTVAIGGWDGVVELWATSGTDAPLKLAAHADQVKTLAFHPTDGRLASAGMDQVIKLWDTTTGDQLGDPIHRHDGTVYTLAFSPDGSLLASGGYDGTIQAVPSADPHQPAKTIATRHSPIRSLAFSPDSVTLAGTTGDGSLLMLSTAKAQIPGAELAEVQLALERLVELTRP